MFQRIKAIDTEFESYNRTYLSISLVSHKNRTEEIKGNVRIVYVNWLIHFAFISKMVKVLIIYMFIPCTISSF